MLQIAADPAVWRAYVLAGHTYQGGGPAIVPWADHLLGVDRETGSVQWQIGTPSRGIPDHSQRLSGLVADQAHHHVILAMGQDVLVLDGATGAVLHTLPLPANLDCVGYPAPQQSPTMDTRGRVLFPCRTTDSQSASVGALVDVARDSVTIVAAPPYQGPPQPGVGILGHRYTVTDSGLFVTVPGGGDRPRTVEELPFNATGPSTMLVETDTSGAPTGRLYLAGEGVQVLILQDADPAALGNQTGNLWASVLAQRAVALTVAPDRFKASQTPPTLPTLPHFLVAPGQLAVTACYGETSPLAPGSATASTAITQQADGTFSSDLRLEVRDVQGHVAGSRHWVVAVRADGTATLLTDEGDVDPFAPLPPTACPL
jgi:hypothetical protein